MAAQGDREDMKLVIQRSQLRQHGEFWHVSVSERQKLRVPFLRTVLPPEVGESARAMASTARQKRSYLHHQGEFQLQNCTVGTVHDSDHEGVVRIFVGHSYHSNELFTLYYWGERERAPHRRVCCKFSIYIYICMYRTSCRKSLLLLFCVSATLRRTTYKLR